ncbi:MAG: type II toxin-antitoxin system HicA family toxin [Armatimonadetes bacterium]|nr:type II toxin-antitoxin system HicA family toxin [Armatimonadota bacterium]
MASLPVHGAPDVKPGTLLGILAYAGLTLEEFARFSAAGEAMETPISLESCEV